MKFVVLSLLTLTVLLQTGESLPQEPVNDIKLNNRIFFDINALLADLNGLLFGTTSKPIVVKADDVRDQKTCNTIKQKKLNVNDDVLRKCSAIENANGAVENLDYRKCEEIQKLYETVLVKEDVRIACDKFFYESDIESLSVSKTKEKCERILKKNEGKVIPAEIKIQCIKLVDNAEDQIDFPTCVQFGNLVLRKENGSVSVIPAGQAALDVSVLPPDVARFQPKCEEILTIVNNQGFDSALCKQIFDYQIPTSLLKSEALRHICPVINK